jgi:hypothetical protein
MNDTSQMGITIAGVAVVSAIAAVAFNKLNEEPRLSRGSSRQYTEETYPGYESDEGVEPPSKLREWARENESRRPKRDDDFGEYREAPSTSSFASSSVPVRESSFASSSVPRDSSFDSGASTGVPRDSSFGSSASSQLKDYEEYDDRPSDDFQSITDDLDERRSSSMVQRPSLGQSSLGPSSSQSSLGPSASQPVQSSQGMLGGRGHTRCKHCHSRLRYTRRK